MSPKTLNYTAAGIVVGLILLAGYGLYRSGRQAERADRAEQALSDSTQAYTARERLREQQARRDSAAEAAYEASVDTFIRYRVSYDTLRLTTTDTVFRDAADEAIGACTNSLLACSAALAEKDSSKALLEAQVRNLEAQVSTLRALSEARCSGTVPTWTLPVVGVAGLIGGAYIRGQ